MTTGLVDAGPLGEELATVLALAEQARAETRPDRGGELLLDHDWAGVAASERLAHAASDPDQRILVGRIDGVVVGYGVARGSEQGSVRLAMIDELYVHPDARGIGVAAAILSEVRAWAVETACVAIESQVLPGNRDAKNFFERVGMKTRQMRVSAFLDD